MSGINRSRATATVIAAVAVALWFAPSAQADVDAFTVNTTGDDGELLAGDNVCDSDVALGEQCTLRGAILETSEGDPASDVDTIGFSAGLVGAQIQLGSFISIADATSINGCSSAPNTAGPCVGVRGNSTADVAILAAEPVTIRGLAITNSSNGVFGSNGTAGLTIKNNWFGIQIDGDPEGNVDGVELTEDDAVIGGTAGATGTSPADRNVFANNTDGLALSDGADNAQIQGNYFGVEANGTTAAANTGDDIVLNGNGVNAPTDTLIGGTQPTPGTCSGPCNVISGGSTGINTNGGTQDAAGTTIKGNFIGLNATGTAAIGNSTGIRHVSGDGTTIGGPAAGDRNYITGGAHGIFSNFGGAANFRIENNYIGTNVSGTDSLSPPSTSGMSIASEAIQGATLIDNVVSNDDTSGEDGVQLIGEEAVFDGNSIGVGTGGQTLEIGSIGLRTISLEDSTISNNTIGNSSLDAISLEGSDGNTLTGNRIGVDANGGAEPNTARAIHVTEFLTDHAIGNVIGGSTAASENVISNTGNDPIEIDDDGSDDNTAGRNTGSNNGNTPDDTFIDLWDDATGDGPGNPATGANNGIQAPLVTSATDDVVAGAGATANATVTIFTTPDTADPTDLTAFLAQATANGAGAWQAPVNIPNGTRVTALQTDASGDSSELSSSMAAVADPPETTITGGPRKRSRLKRGKRKKRVSFSFTTSEPGEGGFQCQIDNQPFVTCASPFARKVRRGRHTFRVRAFDDAGNPDPSLEIRTFRILRPRRAR